MSPAASTAGSSSPSVQPAEREGVTAGTGTVHEYWVDRARQGVLRSMLPLPAYFATVWRHRGLVWNFFRRELLGRFRGSTLGLFWVLVHPLCQFAVFYLVFGILFGPKAGVTGAVDPLFPFHLFFGIVVYGAFQEATARSCTVIVDNGNLVKKVAFPCELLPVHLVLVAFMVFAVGALLVLALGIPLGVVQPSWLMLAWPAVIVVHALFALGVSLFLACWFVFARDAHHLWGIAVQLGMFLSPVMWWFAQIKHLVDDVPALGVALRINPMWWLINAHRQAVGLGHQIRGDVPIVAEPFLLNLGVSAAWAAGALLVGYGVFMSRRHKFADLV
jgi:lipopolysaccharide transport system permease protein